MKKNVLKMGLLVLVVALIAACAEPKKEDGNKSPTIIRLYLDRGAKDTLVDGDQFNLVIGEEILTPFNYNGNNYPYTRTTLSTPGSGQDPKQVVIPGFSYADSKGAFIDKGKHAGYVHTPDLEHDTTFQNDRRKVVMIKPGMDSSPATPSVISRAHVGKKVLWSGTVTLHDSTVGATSGDVIEAGLIQAVTDTQIYVDIMLYDASQNFTDALTVFSGSMNAYIELDVTKSKVANGDTYPPSSFGGTGTGYMRQGKYYYTPNKKGFNDEWKFDKTLNASLYRTNNANIKTVNLKPGINEIRLAYFSNNQFHDQLQ